MTARKPQSFAGRKINPPDAHKPGRKPLTDEEREFIVAAVARGLGNRETVRLFFRKFNQDVSENTVRNFRRMQSKGAST